MLGREKDVVQEVAQRRRVVDLLAEGRPAAVVGPVRVVRLLALVARRDELRVLDVCARRVSSSDALGRGAARRDAPYSSL